MTTDPIIYRRDGHVAVITLNRPRSLNAVNISWLDAFEEVVDRAAQDDVVRAVIITGAGRAFCAGADLREWQQFDQLLTRTTSRSPQTGAMRMFTGQWFRLEKPTIAAVNGPAVGGGFALALASDLLVASEHAKFSQIFVKRGLVPDSGSTYLLSRAIGRARASELVLTGATLNALEAKEWGIVNYVVPHDQLMIKSMELASDVASHPPTAVRLSKQALDRAAVLDLETTGEYEASLQRTCVQTDDFRERMEAFLDKRS